MIEKQSVVAIIPAQGGSKGIPRKNLFEIENIPIVQYTIDEALKSNYIDSILISTDDQEIANYATSQGCTFNGFRPEEISDDHARTFDAVLWELQNSRKIRHCRGTETNTTAPQMASY